MSLIPQILHFTWKNKEDLDHNYIQFLDTKQKYSLRWCVNTFFQKNPNWKKHFWSDEDIEQFVCEFYPLFFDFWQTLKMIEKIDLFRYMCLYQYGGVFLDTDCICIKPLNDFLDLFPPETTLIAGQEMNHISNWINYPPHVQLNIWSIFATPQNYHLRNLVSLVIGNCLSRPEMPVIEKTSMAAFGDYIYKAAKMDSTIKIAPLSFLSLDGRYAYALTDSVYGEDRLPAFIVHGYHGSWVDNDFRVYAKTMEIRDYELYNNEKNDS